MPRTYEMRRRTVRQAVTRQRIVDATVAMHEAVGGGGATVSAIAAKAGVSRATVLRHFPDERSLLTACTQHYAAMNPPPDPAAWLAISDPLARLEAALAAIYTYHRRTEVMSDRAARDVRETPVLQEVLEPVRLYWSAVRAGLIAGWPEPVVTSTLLAAAIGHAIAFETWRSLVREQGLDDARAIEMMVAMARGLTGHEPGWTEVG